MIKLQSGWMDYRRIQIVSTVNDDVLLALCFGNWWGCSHDVTDDVGGWMHSSEDPDNLVSWWFCIVEGEALHQACSPSLEIHGTRSRL